MTRPFRPTMSEFVQLSYNARKQLNGPASAGEALTADHHINHKNCSSDNTKTLANTGKLSQALVNSRPTLIRDNLHRQDPDCGPSHKLHELHVYNTKTLVNTRKHSQTLINSRPTPIRDNLHRQDPDCGPSHKLHELHVYNTKTLANAHKLSSNAHTRQPAPAIP